MDEGTRAMIDVGELRRLIEAATPGPWALDSDEEYDIMIDGDDPFACVLEGFLVGAHRPTREANAALIVAAVNALPSLLDENERLREALERAEAKFRHYDDLHRLKCTAEGDEKADRNREMADMCRTALTGEKT